ncbi:MAG TPA: aminoglycoside phosphotransferase family protein, partial [Flavisolibacter sp.]|nr:aminoglycoside phosphotransferase family protein [Flavisolibacter sp.]
LAYSLDPDKYEVQAFGDGLINQTYKVQEKTSNSNFLLQQINTSIFKKPEEIALNIKNIAAYLHSNHPSYLLPVPLQTIHGNELYIDEQHNYFRLFPFIENSHSINRASTENQAYQASQQFGLFTKLLSGFNSQSLKATIPNFHNLTLRYHQFLDALVNGNNRRIKDAQKEIEYLKSLQSLTETYDMITRHPDFKQRVMHHDTKISNVLFDNSSKAICIVDLDTVMPGYFISDTGDIFRTYLSPVDEEEADLDKIQIRTSFFKAIVEGYLSEMKDELSETEKQYFLYAGKFMIYMQALRFIADYLNNDIYYGARYEGHNLVRGKNQVVLLQKFIEKEEELQNIMLQLL